MAAEDGEGEPAAGARTPPRVSADSSPEAVAMAGRRAGKSLREIAVDLYGAERVAAGWHRDGWMRATVQRLAGGAGTGSDGRSGVAGPDSS